VPSFSHKANPQPSIWKYLRRQSILIGKRGIYITDSYMSRYIILRCTVRENYLSELMNAVRENLLRCYEQLVTVGFFPKEELILVSAWLDDFEKASHGM